MTLFENGVAREVESARARKEGFTILDLSDDWVPPPFTEETGEGSAIRPNSYRGRYIDLANDRTDHRGAPLPKGRPNHLELYGIPPSLSALGRRALGEEVSAACYAAVDRAPLGALDRSIHYVNDPAATRRISSDASQWEGAFSRMLKRQGWKDEAEAEARATGADRATLRSYRLMRNRLAALRAAQQRISCEGLDRPEYPVTLGLVNWNHHRAVVRFERKHMIFGWGQLWGETLAALLRAPRENLQRTLLRVLRERLANQLGLLEDGSVPRSAPRAAEAGGSDRLSAMVQAAAEALGVTSPDKAFDFLTRWPEGWFQKRRVALRLPPLPAYHEAHMDLKAVIDRGDLWYDFPYDEAGRTIPQPIARRPRLTLYARHEGQLLPLVRWATTIGGWRTEVHRGCHYWKYKESDVGDRSWKYLVAAPVWIPPPGTPPRSLVTQRLVKGRVELHLKDYEIGPGYLSAYGLVAAIHTREVRRRELVEDGDDGIRTHGSADYMSILTSHSHGCHRLHNHLAVRLASFLLHHRRHRRIGEQPLKWNFSFEHQGKRFSISRDHKGYVFHLDPPVPITVTRGNILGKAKAPISRYMNKREQGAPEAGCPDQPGSAAHAGAGDGP
ncbi:MAG: hypothetical protein RBU30_08030 [Polyangia bacterium]|nr:hypothetical protein [Polyangia bacterium]